MRATCGACGRPDALGLGLCAECGGGGDAGDTLIFVRRAPSRSDRMAAERRLAELLGVRVDTFDGRLAARGERALVRVPASVSEAVCESLESNGVPAHSIGAAKAVLAMPSHFFVMVMAMALAGTLAGIATGSSTLAALGPLFATVLLAVAHRSLQQPWLRAPAGESLPGTAEAAVLAAFARLGAGRARELLADLVSMARPLIARLKRDGDPAGLTSTIADLVSAASETALEVDRLTTSAAVVRDEMDGADDGALQSAVHTCEDAARTGTRRLVDAVAAVADAGGRTAMLDGSASRRMEELLKDLRDEAGQMETARREIDRLLNR